MTQLLVQYDYQERVEPSVQGGKKMAQALVKMIKKAV